jgi:hypothetical protein
VTSISRRTFLVCLGAGAVAIGALCVSPGLRSWIMKQIAAEFGADIADTDDAGAFANDLMAYLERTKPSQYRQVNWYFRLKARFVGDLGSPEDELRGLVVSMFLLSTNYVLARETGADFHYVALCDPYLNPCSNQLNAFHLGGRTV